MTIQQAHVCLNHTSSLWIDHNMQHPERQNRIRSKGCTTCASGNIDWFLNQLYKVTPTQKLVSGIYIEAQLLFHMENIKLKSSARVTFRFYYFSIPRAFLPTCTCRINLWLLLLLRNLARVEAGSWPVPRWVSIRN